VESAESIPDSHQGFGHATKARHAFVDCQQTVFRPISNHDATENAFPGHSGTGISPILLPKTATSRPENSLPSAAETWLRRKFASEFSPIHAHGSYEALLADPAVEPSLHQHPTPRTRMVHQPARAKSTSFAIKPFTLNQPKRSRW